MSYTTKQLADIVIKNLNAIGSFENKKYVAITMDELHSLLTDNPKKDPSKEYTETIENYQNHMKYCKSCNKSLLAATKQIEKTLDHSKQIEK